MTEKKSIFERIGWPNNVVPTGIQRDSFLDSVTDPLQPVVVNDPKLSAAKAVNDSKPAPMIEFPAHLYAPYGAQTVDIRRLALMNAGELNYQLFNFVAPESSLVVFTHYAVFTDATDASLINFVPTINGNRIMPYHGDPANNFKIDLSIGPDLAEQSLIPAQIILQPGQVLTWTLSNSGASAQTLGVRMKGYLDFSGRRAAKMGG